MKYVIMRTLDKDPHVAGWTFYLSGPDWWTLNFEKALKFNTRRDAEQFCDRGTDSKIVGIE